MGTPSFNGGHPLTIRVKDVSRTSFKWQMQEWSYLDGPHTKETVSFMVVESGAHKLPDGSWVVAGAGTKNVKRQSKIVKFAADFDKAPVVFSQITTQEKYNPYTTRMRSITNKSFRVYLKAEEKKKVAEEEEVSWVAWSLSKDQTTPW
jgi:hypothetical protein